MIFVFLGLTSLRTIISRSVYVAANVSLFYFINSLQLNVFKRVPHLHTENHNHILQLNRHCQHYTAMQLPVFFCSPLWLSWGSGWHPGLEPRLSSGPIIWAPCVSLSFHISKMWTILQLAQQVDAGLKTQPASGAQVPGSKPPLQGGGYSTPWLFTALPKPPRQFPPMTPPHPPLPSSSRPFKGKQGRAPGPGISLRRWHPALSRGTKVIGPGRPGAAAATGSSPTSGASGAQ